MVVVTEHRITLPMTVEEYRVGLLHTVAETSENETGGGEGVEIITNEPFKTEHEDLKNLFTFGVPEGLVGSIPTVAELPPGGGQYTHKILHLQSKVPDFIRMLAPNGSLEIEEKAWNMYPYCFTCYSNPNYMKDAFHLTIDSKHFDNDDGKQDNVFGLSESFLAKRRVVHINLADNKLVSSVDYDEALDPTKFKSEKTGRGPLTVDWEEEYKQKGPLMCIYKLSVVNFKWWGLQDKVESVITKSQHRLLRNFARRAFCSIDRWHGMTMDEIRAMEAKMKQTLDQLRSQGEARGVFEQ